jgi:GNAT superfamily N-acetyltransferase
LRAASQHDSTPDFKTAADYVSFLSTKLEDPDAAILVAEAHTEVIGYVYAAVQGYDYLSLRGRRASCTTSSLTGASRPRRRGLLLNAALAYLKARGAPRVALSTAEGNRAAQRLFEGMGFRRTMVEMTRELAQTTTCATGSLQKVNASGSMSLNLSWLVALLSQEIRKRSQSGSARPLKICAYRFCDCGKHIVTLCGLKWRVLFRIRTRSTTSCIMFTAS